MKSTDDITKDLKKSTINKSTKNLEVMMQLMKQNTNPFAPELSEDHLYNISKGQSVNDEIYKFLSSVEIEGEKQKNFIAETRVTPDRFDKAITKNKIINFDYKNTQKVKINGKMKEVKMQRDVFGRLLYASLTNKIDIEKASSYSLAPIPFSLCHTNGTICKTFKSVVINELLEYQNEIVNPPEAHIHLVDGFHLLHTLKNLPSKYGKISMHTLKMLTYNRKEVHIIFDNYKKPSINDFGHDDLRGEEDTQYDVIRKDNNRPADFCKLLRSNNFKEKFVEFLIEDWTRDEFITLITGKTIKFNYDQCYSYEVSSENKIKRVIDYNLSCYHEEASTKIVYHICQLNTNYRVEIHCADSDIPIIMLENFKHLKDNIEIIINYSMRKKRPSSILMKNENFQEAFIKLLRIENSALTTSNEVQYFFLIREIIEEYVCRVYSLKTKNDINRGRYELFEKGYKSKNESEEILKRKIVGYDPSSLPPTKQELLQQIKRTVFICNVWCNAHMRYPMEKLPENFGWTIIDGKYEYYWFDGPQSPSFEELSSDMQVSNDKSGLVVLTISERRTGITYHATCRTM
ncbi:Protein of unknown function [Cotesia congregata]|uniref:Uncharacterized protein n=1 Tax=Cotesia congregata TaxID=51543 RepID=A0A8J2HFL0_COTCN|nr:Protein of unknown function [Cotesia congregata]